MVPSPSENGGDRGVNRYNRLVNTRWPIFIAFAVVAAAVVAFFVILGLAIADPDAVVIERAEQVAPWTGGLAAIVLAALTWLYVNETSKMAKATAALAAETKKAREEATRPVVIAEMRPDQQHLAWLVIRNAGNGVARELRFSCDPDMRIVNGTLMELPLFGKGLGALAPGAEIRTILDFIPNMFRKHESPTFAVRLSYKDDTGVKLGPYEFPIDFTAYKGLIPGQSEMRELIEAVKRLEKRETP